MLNHSRRGGLRRKVDQYARPSWPFEQRVERQPQCHRAKGRSELDQNQIDNVCIYHFTVKQLDSVTAVIERWNLGQPRDVLAAHNHLPNMPRMLRAKELVCCMPVWVLPRMLVSCQPFLRSIGLSSPAR